VDFAIRLHSDVSPSDGDTAYPFVCTTIAFATWKEAVVVVFSLVSIEICLSSKTLLAYSAVKGIVVFA
jgi:hypothetical protein